MKNVLAKVMVFGIIIIFIGGSFVLNISGIEGNFNHISNSNSDDFDSKIESFMDLGHWPSLVACIVKNDTVVWSKAYGYSHYYRRINATVDTVYPIASVTKSITATAIMQLNESGLIGLDTNVNEYLPFVLKNPRHPTVNITPRMLLAHQSSLEDSWIKYFLFARFFENPCTWIKIFYKNPSNWMDYAPGEGVFYATQGTNILGLIVEQATSQSFADYCQENIFKPLNMTNTSFYFSYFDKGKITGLYVWEKGIYFKMPYIESEALEFAGGGLKSTILDMSHFMIMHTSGGIYDGVRILSNKSVEEMHRVQYPGYYDEGFLHGFGWYSNETYGGHGGNHLGARAVMKMRYSDRVGVVFFWNQNSYLRLHYNRVRPEESEARRGIEKTLFEKADEL